MKNLVYTALEMHLELLNFIPIKIIVIYFHQLVFFMMVTIKISLKL